MVLLALPEIKNIFEVKSNTTQMSIFGRRDSRRQSGDLTQEMVQSVEYIFFLHDNFTQIYLPEMLVHTLAMCMHDSTIHI